MKKKWYKSKTLTVNGVAAALVAAEASTGILQSVLPFNVYAVVATVLPVINAYLRTVTNSGLTTKDV